MYRQAYKCNLSEFTPIFTSISCPVKFQIPVISGQYCDIISDASAGSKKVNKSGWIYSQFNRSNLTGHEILVKMGVNSLPVHSIAIWSNLVVIISMDLLPIRPVEFDQSNSTGHKLLVKLGVNSLR